MMRITAVLTCFNRRDSTVVCLGALKLAAERAEVDIDAVLVDDGSTDGTAAEVRARFSWVTVVQGTGALFWNRGMHLAMRQAMDRGQADALLWLNDDTHLLPEALVRLIEVGEEINRIHGRAGIVVGATFEHGTQELSYGGMNAAGRLRRFTYRKVHSDSNAMPCETMNGNCVLLPSEVARSVGNLDPVFEHSMGDIDYGLRARELGHPIYVAPGFIGRCSTNSCIGTHADSRLPLRARWQRIVGRKGLPPRSWLRLTRRHGGWLWPIYFAWPYARLLATAFRSSRIARRDSCGG
jgi:GT2 family glycosyltransferase